MTHEMREKFTTHQRITSHTLKAEKEREREKRDKDSERENNVQTMCKGEKPTAGKKTKWTTLKWTVICLDNNPIVLVPPLLSHLILLYTHFYLHQNPKFQLSHLVWCAKNLAQMSLPHIPLIFMQYKRTNITLSVSQVEVVRSLSLSLSFSLTFQNSIVYILIKSYIRQITVFT